MILAKELLVNNPPLIVYGYNLENSSVCGPSHSCPILTIDLQQAEECSSVCYGYLTAIDTFREKYNLYENQTKLIESLRMDIQAILNEVHEEEYDEDGEYSEDDDLI